MRIVTRLESVVAASKVALREAENEHGRVEQGHAERKARSDECRAELRRWEASAEEHSQEELRNRCTVAEASAFFSFRRDGVTGRMAAAIWRR